MSDVAYMQRALELAGQAEGQLSQEERGGASGNVGTALATVPGPQTPLSRERQQCGGREQDREALRLQLAKLKKE